MIHRSASSTDRRCIGDGAADVSLCAPSGGDEIVATRQACGDRGGERAPGPVRVTALDSRRSRFVELATVEQQVDDYVRRALSPWP